MAQDQQLRAIVQRMVERGETEDAIAEVVRNYETMQPAVSHDEPARSSRPSDAPELRGYPGLQRLVEGAESGGIMSGAPAAIGQTAVRLAPKLSSALRGGAERMYGSLLKAKDATMERFPNVVRDLIDSGAAITQGGRQKVIGGLRRVGAEKDALLRGADERAMIPRETLRGGLDDVLDDAISTSDAPVKDMTKLAKIERDLVPDELGLLPSRADKIKSRLQSESDRAYRQMKMGTRVSDTTARAKTAIADRAKGALEYVEPRLKDVNARYASGKGQAEALRESLKRIDKHNLISSGDVVSGVAGAMGGPVGVPVGVATWRTLTNPAIGSRTAIALDRVGRTPYIDEVAQAALLKLLSERSNQQ